VRNFKNEIVVRLPKCARKLFEVHVGLKLSKEEIPSLLEEVFPKRRGVRAHVRCERVFGPEGRFTKAQILSKDASVVDVGRVSDVRHGHGASRAPSLVRQA
jgi:hypothetical protein